MKRILITLLTVLSVFGGNSCYIPHPEVWNAEEIPMCSTMRLWEITRMAMEKNGFPIVKIGFDPKDNITVSGWQRSLHPFKGRGIRERVYVRFRRSENAGQLVLGVRVEQQINENLAKPLDPEYADWQPSNDNPDRAKVVLQYMRSILGQELNIGRVLSKEEMDS
ncbi:MAG: hypothetical protein ACI8X5_002933 [Planctomycetota bacterium]|jgi:hypothetical protein